ncbi:MAG: 4Fe-4S dicluster domain-containing protein [Planctomycetes bacterium]|nr:4Fe-4S dicluster domain-containing protein [Planctomycetota bacterium]
MQPAELVDYAKTLDCIHCGLCLRTCPTYRLTGAEPSSPRGRIYLMRAVAEGQLEASDATYRGELDFCLACRHCESVCPAGVRFGEMIESARAGLSAVQHRPVLARLARWFGFELVLRSRWWLSASASAMRFAQRTGMARLLGRWGEALLAMPLVPPRSERAPLAATHGARAPRRGSVAMLEGCAMRELYGRVNRATVQVLTGIGFDTHVPAEHVCCGALHAHNGELDAARDLARATIAAFEAFGDDAIVTNSAGCGAHMKGYGQLLRDDARWRERAQRFSRRVVDFSEFVAAHAPTAFSTGAVRELGTLTYDDPCHLCHGQQVRAQPRTLLELAGARRVELADAEACCGSAGIYSLLRPADSRAVFEGKLAAFEASGADVLVTANPGCHMQWESGFKRAGSRARVLHLAEVLACALDAPAARRDG